MRLMAPERVFFKGPDPPPEDWEIRQPPAVVIEQPATKGKKP
jgi:hypothetical protein